MKFEIKERERHAKFQNWSISFWPVGTTTITGYYGYYYENDEKKFEFTADSNCKVFYTNPATLENFDRITGLSRCFSIFKAMEYLQSLNK